MEYLTAEEEEELTIAQATEPFDKTTGEFTNSRKSKLEKRPIILSLIQPN